jgi:Tol biopolymer transport system component
MTLALLLALLAAPPDLLVFERQRQAGRHAPRDVCTIPAEGGEERCLATGASDDAWPRFLPDGAQVLFSSNRGGSWQLWEVALAGGAPRLARPSRAREWQADVSPDGKRLALLSDAPGRDSLRLVPRAGGPERELLRQGPRTVMGNPDFSPDGRSLVFSSNGMHLGHHIYLWSDGASEPRRLSSLAWGGCSPRFSTDGTKVLYVVRSRLKTTSTIVEHDLASGRERTLVDWPGLNYDPAPSPDGSEIAFASTVTGAFQVYRLRLSDGKSWRVTFAPGAARMPDYRPR